MLRVATRVGGRTHRCTNDHTYVLSFAIERRCKSATTVATRPTKSRVDSKQEKTNRFSNLHATLNPTFFSRGRSSSPTVETITDGPRVQRRPP